MKGISCYPSDLSFFAETIVGRGKKMRFKAKGRSMLPLVPEDGILTVAPADPDRLMPGDIIFVQRDDGGLLAHRFISRSHGGAVARLLTKGDSSVSADPEVSGNQLLGRVLSAESPLGHFDFTGKAYRLNAFFFSKIELARLRMARRGPRKMTLLIIGRAAIYRSLGLLRRVSIALLLKSARSTKENY